MGHQFPARLRELRKRGGLLQRQVEEALSLRPGALSQYERGLREPGFDLLLAVADFFNVSVDFLLGRTEKLHGEPALLEGRLRLKQLLQDRAAERLALAPGQRLAWLLRLAESAAPEYFASPKLTEQFRVKPEHLTGHVSLPPDVQKSVLHRLGLPPGWLSDGGALQPAAESRPVFRVRRPLVPEIAGSVRIPKGNVL